MAGCVGVLITQGGCPEAWGMGASRARPRVTYPHVRATRASRVYATWLWGPCILYKKGV